VSGKESRVSQKLAAMYLCRTLCVLSGDCGRRPLGTPSKVIWNNGVDVSAEREEEEPGMEEESLPSELPLLAVASEHYPVHCAEYPNQS